ncbi:MAG: serpin family protein [Faecousia sp.]
MKNQEQFSEEVRRRAAVRRKNIKARRIRMALSCVSAVLCVAMLVLFMPQSAPVSAESLMENITPAVVEGKAPDRAFMESQTDFALKIFRACAAESEGENTLVSPLSVMLALSMTANGADGDTRAEMEAVLGMPVADLNRYLYSYVNQLPSTDTAKLSIANSIWFRNQEDRLQVNRDFLQCNADYYGADAFAAPFDASTLRDINGWVKEHTDGMIDKILEEISDDAVLYLINALVFDAKWESPYTDTTMVYSGTFTALDGQKQTVSMMNQQEFGYLSDGKACGFVKNYAGGDYKFVALLPNEEIPLSEYVASLTADGVMELLQNVKAAFVNAAIPQFSYDYSIELNDILKDLGMPSAFSGSRADFGKMATSSLGNLYIGQVLHKTHITVDTQGTKAAAVTEVEMMDECGLMHEYTVILNRPFLYMIVDSATNLPVFIGTVNSVS